MRNQLLADRADRPFGNWQSGGYCLILVIKHFYEPDMRTWRFRFSSYSSSPFFFALKSTTQWAHKQAGISFPFPPPSRWVKTRFFHGLTAKVLFRFFYWTPVHWLLPPTVSYLESTSSLIAARAEPISKWLRPWPCTDRQRRYFYDFLVVVIVFRWIAEYFFSSPRRLFNAERKMKAKRRRRRRGMFLGSPSSSRCVWLRVRPSVGRWVDGVSLWALRWWMESEWRRVWFVACNTDKKRRENDGHTFITFLRLLTTLSRVCYFSSLFIRSSFRQDDQKKKKLDVEHNKRKRKFFFLSFPFLGWFLSRCAICVGK